MKLDGTFMHFLLEHQMRHKRTLNFLVLMESIVNAAKSIQHCYNIAAVQGNTEATKQINIQGETVMKLDEMAHEIVLHYLQGSKQVIEATSEEAEDPINLNDDGRYLVYFDPLDGSSNVKHSLPIGFLFGIAKKNLNGEEDLHLRSGRDYIAAGMFLIPSGIFTFSLKNSGTWRFLMGEHGSYVRPTKVEFPKDKTDWELSYNSANIDTFNASIYNWIEKNRSQYSFRYAGSLAVDFHRLLNNGGAFMYPAIVNHSDPKKNRPEGKLRLMYECSVVGFIAEEAGGMAIGEDGKNILDIPPIDRHQRSALYLGSRPVIEDLAGLLS